MLEGQIAASAGEHQARRRIELSGSIGLAGRHADGVFPVEIGIHRRSRIDALERSIQNPVESEFRGRRTAGSEFFARDAVHADAVPCRPEDGIGVAGLVAEGSLAVRSKVPGSGGFQNGPSGLFVSGGGIHGFEFRTAAGEKE